MLCTSPAVDLVAATSGGHFNRWQSRVSGRPEYGGELPVSALAEEMLTEGEGQVRALVTVAGNPVLSTPNGRQLEQALDGLFEMIAKQEESIRQNPAQAATSLAKKVFGAL